jgi:dipeptidyl aminopeptidase/acylaminoacyl peptidase
VAPTRRTPFHALPDYLALPRLSGLALSPDGERLVTTAATPNPDGTAFSTALWGIDPSGRRPARRLTSGTTGESSPAFTSRGDLLFVTARPDPELPTQGSPPEPPPALWLLPRDGGEARPAGERAGGLAAPTPASAGDTVLAVAPTLPGSVTGEDDATRRTARRERKVTAILHSGYPVRQWDHDLGPDQPRLVAGRLGDDDTGTDAAAGTGRITWRDLTPTPGDGLRESAPDLSPDGTRAVVDWAVREPYGRQRRAVVAIDVRSGERRTLLDEPGFEFLAPKISPDGRTVVVTRERRSTPTSAPRVDLVTVPLAGGAARELTAGWDRWPTQVRWTPDSAGLVVAADSDGRAPLFAVSVPDGRVTRLTGDDGAYTDPCVSPDGGALYALRATVGSPPAPVRLDPVTPDQYPTALRVPAAAPELPGRLTEVTATAEDGSPLRAWLALPHGAGPAAPDGAPGEDAAGRPAPLLLWIHGGPLASWNTWQWRWNPWLMVARGYAVLLPDPALSTGYGQAFVERGWGSWGAAPYTDLLALTDAAEARPDVDHTRTAAMGGSFGGYMANWVAGHTDRFAAIVTHASLWALDQFGPTTDDAQYWLTEMTAEMAEANSPHRHVDAITTPMLVIHGDRDYRVPVGEALRLWWELLARQEDPERQPHRFLYFPDENHIPLTCGNTPLNGARVVVGS